MTGQLVVDHDDDTAARATTEDVAAYWDRRPCNIRHSTRPVGSREYFDDVERRKYLVEPHIPGFADFPAWRGRTVLEIGCGLGTDAVGFARAGADYVGVDLSQESVKLASQRFEVYGLSGTFHVADAERLTAVVPDRGFDLVYSFGVIHHTPRPDVALAQARQLVADDGELRIMLYAKHSWKDVMIAAGLDQPEAQSGCPVAFRYDRQEVEDLLQGAGFHVTSIEQTHIFPYVVEKYVQHEYEVQPWFAAMPENVFRALESQLGWHLLITAVPV